VRRSGSPGRGPTAAVRPGEVPISPEEWLNGGITWDGSLGQVVALGREVADLGRGCWFASRLVWCGGVEANLGEGVRKRGWIAACQWAAPSNTSIDPSQPTRPLAPARHDRDPKSFAVTRGKEDKPLLDPFPQPLAQQRNTTLHSSPPSAFVAPEHYEMTTAHETSAGQDPSACFGHHHPPSSSTSTPTSTRPLPSIRVQRIKPPPKGRTAAQPVAPTSSCLSGCCPAPRCALRPVDLSLTDDIAALTPQTRLAAGRRGQGGILVRKREAPKCDDVSQDDALACRTQGSAALNDNAIRREKAPKAPKRHQVASTADGAFS
jgi:hypothetical protein